MSAEELRTELNHVRYQHDIYGKEYHNGSLLYAIYEATCWYLKEQKLKR
jgi:hypothetical protein